LSRKTEVFLFYACAFFPVDEAGKSCLNKQSCEKITTSRFSLKKAKFFLNRERQGHAVLYNFYRITGAIFYPLLVTAAPLLDRLLPNWQLTQRLGRYQNFARSATGAKDRKRRRLIWIHAASVGEVQAARALIAVLDDTLPDAEIFLTTMTRQGRAVARSLLPARIRCELAPLDISQVVAKAVRLVQPDLYICLETEFWPVMLTTMHRAGVPLLLLNGRISENSFKQYLRIKATVSSLLTNFSAVGVIRELDRDRFLHLGVPAERIQVCGNMKYDLKYDLMSKDPNDPKELQESGTNAAEQTAKNYARLLAIQPNDVVFICGSTRTGEEKLLLPVYTRLREKYSGRLLWILAPRHLERLPEVMALLDRAGLGYQLFSRIADSAGRERQKNIILLDSIGELARLYAAGHYIFCGASLVNKGGHNIMEPIAQGKPVFFGPFMQDFQDAVDLVLTAGAGIQVLSPDELADSLLEYPPESPAYAQACQAAKRLARTQQGAAKRQAEMVLRILNSNSERITRE
jgi:3-deoxy-D-manno-octulosonic-acid transferase